MIGLTTRRDKVDGTKRMSPGTVPHPPSRKRGSDRGLQSGLLASDSAGLAFISKRDFQLESRNRESSVFWVS